MHLRIWHKGVGKIELNSDRFAWQWHIVSLQCSVRPVRHLRRACHNFSFQIAVLTRDDDNDDNDDDDNDDDDNDDDDNDNNDDDDRRLLRLLRVVEVISRFDFFEHFVWMPSNFEVQTSNLLFSRFINRVVAGKSWEAQEGVVVLSECRSWILSRTSSPPRPKCQRQCHSKILTSLNLNLD